MMVVVVMMMPFMFVSSAVAPLETMPGWMQAVATLNPVVHTTETLRGHVLGTAAVGGYGHRPRGGDDTVDDRDGAAAVARRLRAGVASV